jgi:hypothetical protein
LSDGVETFVKLQTKLKLLMFWLKYRIYIIGAVAAGLAIACYFIFVRH